MYSHTYVPAVLSVCCAAGMVVQSACSPCVQMKTLSDHGVPIEECLHVLTWQGVVVEASGNVFVTHSDMDNLVGKGIAIAFNNMNSVHNGHAYIRTYIRMYICNNIMCWCTGHVSLKLHCGVLC